MPDNEPSAPETDALEITSLNLADTDVTALDARLELSPVSPAVIFCITDWPD